MTAKYTRPEGAAMTAKYTRADLLALADDKGPFALDNLRSAVTWAADVLDAADKAVDAERQRADAAMQQARQPLTPREIELIDGMIEVQRMHASQCDTMAVRPGGNKVMAEKQKAWDMERIALLEKLKTVEAQPAQPYGY